MRLRRGMLGAPIFVCFVPAVIRFAVYTIVLGFMIFALAYHP